MRLNKLLLSTVIALTLFTCQSDDNNPTTPVLVEGTWALTELLLDAPVDVNMDGMASTNLISEIGCYDQIFTFNADNTGSVDSTQSPDFELVSVNINEYEYVIDCIVGIFSEPLTWTQDSNDISINIDGDVLEGTVAGNMMTFVLEGGAEYEGVENGTVIAIVSDLTFVLTKQ